MDIEINWHRPPEMPEKAGAYLCIVSEPDTLNGQEGSPMYDILYYSAANGRWLVDGAFFLLKWAKLPPVSVD